MRVDDEYESRPKWPSPGQDPNTLQYDSGELHALPSTNFASARAGMNFGAWQVEAFFDNLATSHTVTNYEWSIDSAQCPAPAAWSAISPSVPAPSA